MLVTNAEILAWLKLPPGTGADDIIATINTMVTADCCQYTDRALEQSEATERYTGDGGPNIQLKRYPIMSITTLKIGSGSALTEGWDKDFVVDKESGIITLTSGGFPATPPQAVEVKYYAGYVATATSPTPPTGELITPADLKMSLCKAAAFQYYAQDKRRAGIESVTTPDQSVTYVAAEYPRDVLNVWRRHRRMNVG
jgi:hypothetical protein